MWSWEESGPAWSFKMTSWRCEHVGASSIEGEPLPAAKVWLGFQLGSEERLHNTHVMENLGGSVVHWCGTSVEEWDFADLHGDRWTEGWIKPSRIIQSVLDFGSKAVHVVYPQSASFRRWMEFYSTVTTCSWRTAIVQRSLFYCEMFSSNSRVVLEI